MTPTEVAIVSIFGRGHWLAVELAKAGIPVSLVDVSGDQGPWSEVDSFGPFGAFPSEISIEQNAQVQKQGLTLWLGNGPLELGSGNADYRIQKLGLSTLNKKYMQGQVSGKEIQKLAFSENWLAQLSHTWNATISKNASEALSAGESINLFAEFSHYRFGQSSALEKSLAWCERNQVRVFRAKHIKDLALEKKGQLSGLEVHTEKSQVLKAEQFVWCLSQAETRKLSEKIRSVLFPQGVIYPEWAWVRYRIEILNSDKLNHWLPNHCVILTDVNLPWSHENFVIMQRTEENSKFDCWMKIPHSQRFQKSYLQEMASKLENLLQHKISGEEVKVVEWPLEAKMDEQRLGPTPFVVYRKAHAKPTIREWNNVHFIGPEYWQTSAMSGKISVEKEAFTDVKNWWDKKMEALAKRTKERNS